MIEYRQGDILEADVEALVNTVNCVGIMGRGIALAFKQRYPANFKAYAVACARGEVVPGRMFITETGLLANPRYIINFPTKRHWRSKSRLDDIQAGLVTLVQEIRGRGIRSLAVPPLGSGLGGLNWEIVRAEIVRTLGELTGVRIVIFTPLEEGVSFPGNQPVPNMTPGRAALVGLMARYLAGLMDPHVTLLEVHKLMYFMQAAGEPLRLRYVKAPFGPYAENLRHVLLALDEHMITGYGQGGEMPDKPIELLPGAVEAAAGILAQHPATQARFQRVADLVSGYESPFGLELLATVHWIVTQEGLSDRDQVVRHVHAWAQHKRQFSADQITQALAHLQHHAWLPASQVGVTA